MQQGGIMLEMKCIRDLICLKGVWIGNVDKWTRCSTLRWFSHVQRMEKDVLTKRAYDSTVEGKTVRGRLPASWDNKIGRAFDRKM